MIVKSDKLFKNVAFIFYTIVKTEHFLKTPFFKFSTTVRQYKSMGCLNVVSKVRCMKSQCWKCCTCNCGCFSTQRLQYLSPKPKITLANHLLVLRKFAMKKLVWGVFVELRLFSVAALIWTCLSPDKMNRQTFFSVALSAQRRTDPMPEPFSATPLKQQYRGFSGFTRLKNCSTRKW